MERPNEARLALAVKTPDGFPKRWADDEPDVDRIPRDLSFTRSIPGGAADASCQLLRDMAFRARDARNFNEVSIYGPGVERIWGGYLTKTPFTKTTASPAATGDAGRLKDDPSLRMIPVDRDPSHWTPPSNARRITLIGVNSPHKRDAEVVQGENGKVLRLSVEDNWVAPYVPRCEAWYDAGQGLAIGRLYFNWSGADSTFLLERRIRPTDNASDGESEGSADIVAAASGTDDFKPTAANRYIMVSWRYSATPAGAAGTQFSINMADLAVYGRDVPQTNNPAGGPPGVTGPDVLKAILNKAGNGVSYGSETISSEDFVIPHLAWLDAVTAEQAILDTNRFFRNLWAVKQKQLYWAPPETFGKLWHVRRDEGTDLQSNGPDSEQEYNGFIVRYDDALTGTRRLVGPPASGFTGPSGLSTAGLVDEDPEMELNEWGRRRWLILDAGLTSEAGAIRIGELAKEALRLRRTSGTLEIGHFQVYDSTGARYPSWAPDAGDRIIVDDEPSAAERLILETSYAHDGGTANLTLDSPPDALEAIQERLQVVLVGATD